MRAPVRHFDFMPSAIAKLPRDDRGYPIPYFAAVVDGKPDFKYADPEKFRKCIKQNRCWICGGVLGVRKWFVLGPMCTITRTTSEPPCHRECAEFACRACPFLTKPLAKRGETHGVNPGGFMIVRNPGVSAIWETKTYELFEADGVLFSVGPPEDVTFWREGRKAKPAEVIESIETGLPPLVELAKKDGDQGVAAFMQTVADFRLEVVDRFLKEDTNNGENPRTRTRKHADVQTGRRHSQ
jgi:hypothetical protein